MVPLGNAQGVECIGPGPCITPVAPPSNCVKGGVPTAPVQQSFTSTSGVQLALQITGSTNCQLAITQLIGSLAGAETSYKTTAFAVWQQGGTGCATETSTVLLQTDMAISGSHPVDRFVLQADSSIVTGQANTTYCIGFASGVSGALEKLTLTWISR